MSSRNYQEFLAQKAIVHAPSGFQVADADVHPMLFGWQRDLVRWAVRRGKACLFEGCGCGKTFQQIEWARLVHQHTNGDILILAPLAVTHQTVEEAAKLGVVVRYCRNKSEVQNGLTIANYEMLDAFDPSRFVGIVLDESSIIKHMDGKTRNAILERFADAPYKLACTATPAPNDHMELGNHAEFVGAMTRTEMLSMFFVHDGGDTAKWRLKGHAEQEFWKWVCSWAVMLRKPSDLGYDDGDFILPPLQIHQVSVEHEVAVDGELFPTEAKTLQERLRARRSSVDFRVDAAHDLIVGTWEETKQKSKWVIWCGLNDEQDQIAEALGDDCVSIYGSLSNEEKMDRYKKFESGKASVLVTKVSMFGFGINMQFSHQAIFLGLNDSWEMYYQAVRRQWRFGQKNKVNVYVITSTAEGAVVKNIERKEADAERMASEMIKHMHSINEQDIKGTSKTSSPYVEDIANGKRFSLHLGDCVEIAKKIEDSSVGFSIFSPPFASLYTYSASDRDMGNAKSEEEFNEHFKFLISELYRITKDGRIVAFHCMNIPAMKERDGYIGLKDFRGDLIRMFQEQGFIFHSEHCIWKDPLTEATRTKALGLMHKQLCKDSVMSRAGIPDYMIAMRKPGVNKEPIAHDKGLSDFIGEDGPTEGVMSHEIWRRYASPVWMDIRQTNTLQRESAREDKDERHICPLQLDVIERALELWSNPDDLVYSPFTGIGSEGYVALQRNRKFIGSELKPSYWKQAVANLKRAESGLAQDLF